MSRMKTIQSVVAFVMTKSEDEHEGSEKLQRQALRFSEEDYPVNNFRPFNFLTLSWGGPHLDVTPGARLLVYCRCLLDLSHTLSRFWKKPNKPKVRPFW